MSRQTPAVGIVVVHTANLAESDSFLTLLTSHHRCRTGKSTLLVHPTDVLWTETIGAADEFGGDHAGSPAARAESSTPRSTFNPTTSPAFSSATVSAPNPITIQQSVSDPRRPFSRVAASPSNGIAVRPSTPGAVAAQAPSHGSVRLRYLENSPVRVRGPVTGRHYDFSASGPVQAVDPRDAVPLLRTRFSTNPINIGQGSSASCNPAKFTFTG